MKRLVAAALLCAGIAGAQEPELPPIRPLRFAEKDGRLLMSAAFPDVFSGELVEQLSSGFAQTVFVRLYVYPEGEDLPVWYTAATYRAVYAQWDEVYLVRIRDPAGERNLTEATRAAALVDVTTMSELPVCPLATLDPRKTYFVGVIVEVNPVTPELVAEVRKWLTRPRGGQVGTDSLFGSFVTIFANPKVPEADRTLRFRSQGYSRR